MSFTTFPHGRPSEVKNFKVGIPDKQLHTLKTLLELSELPKPTYESSLPDRRLGITHKWLSKAKEEWQHNFEWRKHEQHINSFPHYTAQITDDDGKTYSTHFIALFSEKNDAVPIILNHGWPGSFLEFLPMFDLLRKRYCPEDLPYHLVVASIPGYTFSTPPPLDRDFQLQDIARLFDKLMHLLGFGSGYVVQGGDIGSKVARVMAATYPACKAVHINFCIMPEPEHPIGEISALESEGLKRAAEFKRIGSAYALEHATKPSTIGFVLDSSPIALLAWIGEKFLDWTDEDPTLSTILESVSLYWFTRCASTTIYPYRQLFTPGHIGAHENPPWHLSADRAAFGYSFFPKELAPIPRAWAATTGDLVWYREHASGGHFAAVEKTEELLRDIEDFVGQMWKPEERLRKASK